MSFRFTLPLRPTTHDPAFTVFLRSMLVAKQNRVQPSVAVDETAVYMTAVFKYGSCRLAHLVITVDDSPTIIGMIVGSRMRRCTN